MAISSTQINGSFEGLYNALLTLVPDFFASVTYFAGTSEAEPSITCKDEDDNTIFTVTRGNTSSTANWTYTYYKDAETSVNDSSTNAAAKANIFYTVGTNGAIIQCVANHMIIIAKTNTGVTGFVSNLVGPSSGDKYKVKVACWGDDTEKDDLLYCGNSNSNASIGNHCLVVPVPLHGTFGTAMYFPQAFFMPMAQTGMRDVVQAVTLSDGDAMTNGWIGLRDN